MLHKPSGEIHHVDEARFRITECGAFMHKSEENVQIVSDEDMESLDVAFYCGRCFSERGSTSY